MRNDRIYSSYEMIAESNVQCYITRPEHGVRQLYYNDDITTMYYMYIVLQ